MFKEKLLIGQYYAVASPVHRLDARCKIIVTLIYMITLFIANNWLAWATLAIVFLLALFFVPCSAEIFVARVKGDGNLLHYYCGDQYICLSRRAYTMELACFEHFPQRVLVMD